jgi:acyl-coenzyme A synthetase/AMP-(fatty) acid ligase
MVQSPALLYEDTDNDNEVVSCSFGESFELSNRLGYALQHRLGVERGDRIAILMSQSIETAIVHMSVYKTAGIAVPLFILFGPEALEYRLQDSGAKIVFVEVRRRDATRDETLSHADGDIFVSPTLTSVLWCVGDVSCVVVVCLVLLSAVDEVG